MTIRIKETKFRIYKNNAKMLHSSTPFEINIFSFFIRSRVYCLLWCS